MNHSDIVKEFVKGKRKTRRGKNIFYTYNVLYSYGFHFPLAVRLKQGLFLKNGDRYSITTGQHQALTQQFCPGPTMSFRAFKLAGFPLLDATLSTCTFKLVDWKQDTRTYVEKHAKNFDTPQRHDLYARNAQYDLIPFQRPAQGMLIPISRGGALPDGSPSQFVWHILGAVLMRSNTDNKDYICSLDEGNYFVSELPCICSSVAEAFQVLKPEPIKCAERQGKPVVRQGEWFFTQLSETNSIRELRKVFGLPKTYRFPEIAQALQGANQATPNHYCKHDRLPSLSSVGTVVVTTGYVKHVVGGRGSLPERLHLSLVRSSREHKALHLKGWWTAHQNTAKTSWSVSGQFD